VQIATLPIDFKDSREPILELSLLEGSFKDEIKVDEPFFGAKASKAILSVSIRKFPLLISKIKSKFYDLLLLLQIILNGFIIQA